MKSGGVRRYYICRSQHDRTLAYCGASHRAEPLEDMAREAIRHVLSPGVLAKLAREEAERERAAVEQGAGASGERVGRPQRLLTSLRDVFVEQPRALAIAAGISIVWVVGVYTLLLYMPTYVQRSLGFSPSEAFTASVVGNVAMAVGCVLAGRLSDRIGRTLTVRLA